MKKSKSHNKRKNTVSKSATPMPTERLTMPTERLTMPTERLRSGREYCKKCSDEEEDENKGNLKTQKRTNVQDVLKGETNIKDRKGHDDIVENNNAETHKSKQCDTNNGVLVETGKTPELLDKERSSQHAKGSEAQTSGSVKGRENEKHFEGVTSDNTGVQTELLHMPIIVDEEEIEDRNNKFVFGVKGLTMEKQKAGREKVVQGKSGNHGKVHIAHAKTPLTKNKTQSSKQNPELVHITNPTESTSQNNARYEETESRIRGGELKNSERELRIPMKSPLEVDQEKQTSSGKTPVEERVKAFKKNETSTATYADKLKTCTRKERFHEEHTAGQYTKSRNSNQPPALSSREVNTHTKIRVVQLDNGSEVSIHKLSEDKLINLMADEIGGYRSIAKVIHQPKEIILILNNSHKVRELAKAISKAPVRMNLSHHVKIEVSQVCTIREVVLKGVRPGRNPENIKSKLKIENPEVLIKGVRRVTTKDGKNTTVVIITLEGEKIPPELWLDGWEKRTEVYIPSLIQCDNCQKFCHRKNTCKLETKCRFCAGPHSFDQCAKAKNDTNYRVTNPDRCCANCGGNHGARFHGCPEFQKTRVWLKEALEKNIPLRKVKQAQVWQNAHITTQIKEVSKEVSNLKKGLKKCQEQEKSKDTGPCDTDVMGTNEAIRTLTRIQEEVQRDIKQLQEIRKENQAILKRMEAERKAYESMSREDTASRYMSTLNKELLKAVMEIMPEVRNLITKSAEGLLIEKHPQQLFRK
jgi:hypothetical protein